MATRNSQRHAPATSTARVASACRKYVHAIISYGTATKLSRDNFTLQVSPFLRLKKNLQDNQCKKLTESKGQIANLMQMTKDQMQYPTAPVTASHSKESSETIFPLTDRLLNF